MSPRVRVSILGLGLLLLLAAVLSTYLAEWAPSEGRSSLAPERPVVVEALDEGDLEPAPGLPASLPEPPGRDAGVAELWAYGERFLGWTSREEVDLDQYEESRVREWIRKDRQFHGLEDTLVYDDSEF